MSDYTESLKLMTELFGKDCEMALATAKGNVPTVRYVDTYYQDSSFYIVTDENSQKAKDILTNPHVALAIRACRFTGIAINIGHPLDASNQKIRETLIKAFEPWYSAHNDETNSQMCFIKIEVNNGIFGKEGSNNAYKVDFKNKIAEIVPAYA